MKQNIYYRTIRAHLLPFPCVPPPVRPPSLMLLFSAIQKWVQKRWRQYTELKYGIKLTDMSIHQLNVSDIKLVDFFTIGL